jgi:hypothetical protein
MHAHFFFCERQFFFTLALQGCAYVATLFGPPFARTARREEEGLLYFFPLIRTLLDEKGEFPFFLLLIFVRVLLAKKKLSGYKGAQQVPLPTFPFSGVSFITRVMSLELNKRSPFVLIFKICQKKE